MGEREGEVWSNPTPRAGLSTGYGEVIKAFVRSYLQPPGTNNPSGFTERRSVANIYCFNKTTKEKYSFF